jgi:hypothetical protein
MREQEAAAESEAAAVSAATQAPRVVEVGGVLLLPPLLLAGSFLVSDPNGVTGHGPLKQRIFLGIFCGILWIFQITIRF